MTLFGPDGSYHQFGGRNGQLAPWTWLRLSDADWDAIDFVLWRSSIGIRTDWSYPRMRDASLERGKAFAAYHFVYPVGRFPAVAQADTCVQALGRSDIPVMLDWESDGTLRPTWGDVLAVAEQLRRRGVRVPLLYTGRWYWQQVGSPTLAGHGLALVLSRYGSNAPGTATERYEAQGGDSSDTWRWSLGGLYPMFWQFGSRVRWGNKDMDMNATRFPVSELHRWFWTPTVAPPAPTPTPPPPPQPAPPPAEGEFDIMGDRIISRIDGSPTIWHGNGVRRYGIQGLDALAVFVAAGAIDATGKKLIPYLASDARLWQQIASLPAAEVDKRVGAL